MTLAFTDDRDEARRCDGAKAKADENDAKDADDNVVRDSHIDDDECNNLSATARA
jgi:hypothetical protein